MGSDSSKKKKLLLIGWDAADWEHINPLLEQGLLPNLEKFINEGVMGNLATLQPILSPMLWNSAATGKHAYKHGIQGFTEPDHMNGGARPFSSYSRKCKAIWNILSQEGYRNNVINWWASHPAEAINGCVVTNFFNGIKFGPEGPEVGEGTVYPADKAQFYGQFKVFPEEISQEQICAFIPKAAEIVQDEDSRLQGFAKTFAETLSTHAVATAVMEKEPWDFMAVYYTCIDHFAHGFMQYHPPRQKHIRERDYEIFKDVVAGAYRFSDMMLERLLSMTDEDTTVILCSDHGFQSGDQRPMISPREPAGPAIWHRRFGVFLMKGPNIKKDERIYGASLIDITPTILTALDLPIADDMDGRPLLEVFEAEPEVKTIPSWEDVPGADGMHTEEKPVPPEEAEDLLKQFVALGYIDDPGQNKDQQFESADVENKYNLARNYMFGYRTEDALAVMQELSAKYPWETRFVSQLAQCYQACRYPRQSNRVIEAAFDITKTKLLLLRLVWAENRIALGEVDDAVDEVLTKVETLNTEFPSLMNRLGRAYAKLRRWKDAERIYLRAIEMHGENAEAYQGLSRIYCRQGRNQETVNAALAAVGLIHRLPHAHLNLGIALAKSGNGERAITAFQTALTFSPGFVPAHRWMAAVCRSVVHDNDLALKHSRLAKQYRVSQTANKKDQSDRRSQSFEIAEYPSEKEREKILREKRPDRVDPRKKSGKEFVLVSGLPRSGTSLMMQMLEKGGLLPKTDGERSADEDNPRGYYEWEAVKRISSRPGLMNEKGLDELAIKVISMLLPGMPYSHDYKVIFMSRPIDEIVASQSKMIERLGTDGGSEKEMAADLVNHRLMALRWLAANDRVEFLEIDYPTLVESPEEVLPLIVDFLGEERLPKHGEMVQAIEQKLYRQRPDSN